MMGFKVFRRACGWLAAAATLPAMAVAQSNGAALQTSPSLDRFSLPPSTRPTPAPIPTSGPIIAPLSRPTPTPTPSILKIPTPIPTVSIPTRAPQPLATSVARRPATATARPVATPTAQPSIAAPTLTTIATPDPVATATPEAVATPPATTEPTSAEWPTGLLIAIGAGALALVAIAGFLLGRRRRDREDDAEEVAPEPVTAVREPAPEPAKPSANITIPARRHVADEPQPRLEITLIPKRAGTNLTSAAVDYRVVIRNTGPVGARDIRFGMYMLTASARQAQDLQMIFAALVEQPMVAPFDLPPGADVDLSGMALLAREQINVMTIDGKPWFVPVLAMKAEYRWGDNVGAPGLATAAHMIGIDRGEGAKMAPFRLDGGPHMHPEVAERKVA